MRPAAAEEPPAPAVGKTPGHPVVRRSVLRRPSAVKHAMARSRSPRRGGAAARPEQDPASSLVSQGYAVLPLAEPGALASMLEAYWREAPELLAAVRERSPCQLVGGMGKIPLASAWHHPEIRKLRRMAHATAAPVLRSVHERLRLEPCARVFSCPDALVVRHKRNASCKPAEQWHRDSARDSDDRAVLYGGWVNLEGQSQAFACVPGSHLAQPGAALVEVEKRGFVRANRPPDDEIRRVVVGAGEMLVFCERLLHTILPEPCTRLFTGFVTAPAEAVAELPPRRSELRECLRVQGPLWIKSGASLPLLPSTGRFAGTDARKAAAAQWASKTLAPAVAAPVLAWCAAGGKQPECPSLEALGAAFEPYGAEDLELLGLLPGH